MTRRLMIAAAIIIALSVAVMAFLIDLGRDQAELETTIQNEEAGHAADQASSTFDRCLDAGGVYDFATGECRGG